MVFFFLDFSKAPKVVIFSFMVFSKVSKAPKVVLFLFLVNFQISQSCCLHFGFSQSSTIMVFLCYFWLLVNMPIVVFNSLIICWF
jgi:hypothetical protein